jgi:hypothetical protein
VLMQAGLLRGIETAPALTVHTTGDPGIVGPVIARMIGAGITVSNVGALEATVSA